MKSSNPESISPRDFMRSVERGYERLVSFRRNRLNAIKVYTGNRYDSAGGDSGKECAGLLFNAVRTIAPLLAFENPRHLVETPYMPYKQMADLWALALTEHDKDINIMDVYTRCIVDAMFCLGIMKTGLAENGEPISLDSDSTKVMSGEIYTEIVSFDDFVADPLSREHLFRDARWMGSKIRVPRKLLLDSGQYANDLIERLPRAGEEANTPAEEISQRHVPRRDEFDLEDDVEVFEIFVPSANAIITVPAAKGIAFDDFLRISDFYGLKDGPYTFLALTPPVPDNPIPVPLASVLTDLNMVGNQVFAKMVNQGKRQKDVLLVAPDSADDAEQVRDASDGEIIRVADPKDFSMQSFGGQNQKNEEIFQALMNQGNVLAGNISQLGGQNVSVKSATAANILQQNSSVQVEAMRLAVYNAANAEARKRAFYLWTDPLIQMPLTKRTQQPAQYAMGPNGPTMVTPAVTQDIQVLLTPEARQGNFLDYTFSIETESMSRVDSDSRKATETSFCQQVMPAVMSTAQIAQQLMIPFNPLALLKRMARDLKIDWLDEVLSDPQSQMEAAQRLQMGPQNPGKGQPTHTPNPNLGPAVMQNGQPGQVMGNPMGGAAQGNQSAQGGTNAAQVAERSVIKGAFRPTAAPKIASISNQ